MGKKVSTSKAKSTLSKTKKAAPKPPTKKLTKNNKPTKKGAPKKTPRSAAASLKKPERTITPKVAKSSPRKIAKGLPKAAPREKKPKVATGPKGYTPDEYVKFKEFKGKFEKLSNQALKDMLQKNLQSKSGNKDELVLKCADGATLGRIPRCPNCFGGRYLLAYEGRDSTIRRVSTPAQATETTQTFTTVTLFSPQAKSNVTPGSFEVIDLQDIQLQTMNLLKGKSNELINLVSGCCRTCCRRVPTFYVPEFDLLQPVIRSPDHQMNLATLLGNSTLQNIRQIFSSLFQKQSQQQNHFLEPYEEQEMLLCALFKIANCFLDLARLSLSIAETSGQERADLSTTIEFKTSQLSKLFVKIETGRENRRQRGTQKEKVRLLKGEFLKLNIRIPRAPVSAFYLFFLLSRRKAKHQLKSDVSSQWNQLNAVDKEPFQLLATEIHQQYHRLTQQKHYSKRATFKPKSEQKRRGNTSVKNPRHSLEFPIDEGRVNRRESISEESSADILSDSQAQCEVQESQERGHAGSKTPTIENFEERGRGAELALSGVKI